MMLCAIDRPGPVRRPTSFVAKNGSNILSATPFSATLARSWTEDSEA